jgi:tetratricopeptide (TPR) repeat protein
MSFRCCALRTAVSVLAIAACAYGIRVKKVDIKLAVAVSDSPAYVSTDARDKILLKAGNVVIVTPYEDPGTKTAWYQVDDGYDYEHGRHRFVKPGAAIAFRDLSGVITAARVNIRELPSTEAKVTATAAGGEIVTVLARTQNRVSVEDVGHDYWYEVRTAGGTTGWVFGALMGLLQPREAYERAARAIRENDPDAAIFTVSATAERFPSARIYHPARTFDEPHFAFLPTAELLLGYAYFLAGRTDEARGHYEKALTYGDAPALMPIKIIDPDGENSRFKDCDYYAATLARVGLGLTYVRSDAAEAASYLARAVADSESGLSTANIVPEYFDALLVRDLIAMYEAGKMSRACLDRLSTEIPAKCSYDFAPAYFLLYYGEALERRGQSSAAVKLYKKIVDDFPRAYLRDQGGYYTDYDYVNLTARALWRLMYVKIRLGEQISFHDYCGAVAKSTDDKRVGFLAYYAAGIAMDSIDDAERAGKAFSRAERYYDAGELESGDFGYYYEELHEEMVRRMEGRPNSGREEYLFKGLSSGA